MSAEEKPPSQVKAFAALLGLWQSFLQTLQFFYDWQGTERAPEGAMLPMWARVSACVVGNLGFLLAVAILSAARVATAGEFGAWLLTARDTSVDWLTDPILCPTGIGMALVYFAVCGVVPGVGHVQGTAFTHMIRGLFAPLVFGILLLLLYMMLSALWTLFVLGGSLVGV